MQLQDRVLTSICSRAFILSLIDLGSAVVSSPATAGGPPPPPAGGPPPPPPGPPPASDDSSAAVQLLRFSNLICFSFDCLLLGILVGRRTCESSPC